MLECIRCSGALNSSGYGSAYLQGQRVGAHVKAHAIAAGLSIEALAGKVVMHSCDNRWCINPAHLSLGTQKENLKDMVVKQRQNLPPSHGELNNNVVLTDAEVAYIRANHVRGTNQFNRGNTAALAKRFGVARITVQKIVQGVHRVRATTGEPAPAV